MALACSTHAGSIVTTTITVTNAPADGDTITINGDARTWKTTVTATASQVIIGASIGANATNMFNQFARSPFTTLTLSRYGTNGVVLRGIIDQTISVSIAGTWGQYTLSTNTTTDAYQVQVPATSYAVQSSGTNIYSLLVAGIQSHSTNVFSDTTPALANYVSLDEVQTVSNKTLRATTNNAVVIKDGYVTTLDMAYGLTNRGYFFYSSNASPGSPTFAIAGDHWGRPSVYGATFLAGPPSIETRLLQDPTIILPENNNILIVSYANSVYGRLDGTNAFTGTNTFTRITNSTIVGSTLTGNTYSGNIGSLTNGSLVGVTLTSSIFTGSFGTISAGNFQNISSTNLVATNTTLAGTTSIPGGVAFNRSNHTSLANGANAAVNFGNSTFIKIKAGPTAAFSIAGIANGADGDCYYLLNATGQNMTLSHDSGSDPTPANRIYTTTGADIASTGNGMFMVWYDSEDSRWWAAELAD